MSLESCTSTKEHVVQGGNSSSSSNSSICCAATFGPAFGSTLGLAMDAIVVTPSSFGLNNGNPIKETCETTTTTTTTTRGKNASRVESLPSVPRPSQKQEQEEGIVASSDFIVQFPPNCIPKGSSTSTSTSTSTTATGGNGIQYDHQYVILLQINGNHLHESFLSMKLPAQHTGSKNGPQNCTFCTFQQGKSTKPSTDVLGKLVEKSLLTPGRNLVRYFLVQKQCYTSTIDDLNHGCCSHNHHHRYTTIGQAEAYIYLWSVHDSIIISDIDGTLTKSDVRGVIDSIFMERYLDGVGHVHEGVCSLFTDLVKCPPMQLQQQQWEKQQEKQREQQQQQQRTVEDGIVNNNKSSRMGQVRILYLSSRPMQLIHATRKFLSLLSQKRENVKQSSFNNNGNGNGNGSSDHYHTTTTTTTTSACAWGSLSDKVTCCRNGTNTDTTTTVAATATATTKTTTTANTSTSTGISGSQNVWIPAVDHKHGQHASLVGLPPGPIFLHTGTLSTVLYAELVTKSMHEFKADLLTRQVVLPFVAAGKKVLKSPLFLAGFGNKKTDSLAYEMAGMNCNDIYIIDKKSVLVRIEDTSVLEEMEKKENRHNNNNNNNNNSSTSDKQSLAIDGNHGEVDMGACCNAWEPIVTNLCPSENLSSKNISVSNPKKLSSFYSPPPSSSSGASSSSSSSMNRRHFRGYNDPQLRKELFRRITSF